MSGSTSHPSGAIDGCARRVRPAPCPAAKLARPPPTAPCAPAVCSLPPVHRNRHPAGIDLRDPCAGARAHAQGDQLALGLLRKIRWEAWAARAARPPPENGRFARIDVAEVVPQRVVGDLAQRSRQFHARRSAAHDDEVQPRAALLGVLSRARPVRMPAAGGCGSPWRSRSFSAPAPAAPTGRCRNSGASRRWRPPASHTESRRPSGSRGDSQRPGPPLRPVGPACCDASSAPPVWVRRSRRATARPWPPDTAAAGKGGSSGDPPPSPIPLPSRAPWQHTTRQIRPQ